MKHLEHYGMRFLATFLTLFTATLMYAQEKGLDINVDVDKGNDANWLRQQWVWVVGAAIFILLLVAILKSSNKT